MPPIPRITACSAVLVAAVALAATGATGATRGAGAVVGTRARTVAVTPMRIRVLVADGRRLAWGDGFQRIQVFDRVTHRATTVARDLVGIRFPPCGESPEMLGPFLAGNRVLFACEGGSNTGVDGDVFTAALDHRRARRLRGFGVSREAGDVGELYGLPSGSRAVVGRSPSTALTVPGNARMPVSGVWSGGGRCGSLPPPAPERHRRLRARAGDRRVGDSLRLDWLPAWSPDRREIAWNHGGTIWLMRSAGRGSGRSRRTVQPTHAPARTGRPRAQSSPSRAREHLPDQPRRYGSGQARRRRLPGLVARRHEARLCPCERPVDRE